MTLVIIALSMAAGLTFATLHSLGREKKARMFHSLKMSKRYQFIN